MAIIETKAQGDAPLSRTVVASKLGLGRWVDDRGWRSCGTRGRNWKTPTGSQPLLALTRQDLASSWVLE